MVSNALGEGEKKDDFQLMKSLQGGLTTVVISRNCGGQTQKPGGPRLRGKMILEAKSLSKVKEATGGREDSDRLENSERFG